MNKNESFCLDKHRPKLMQGALVFAQHDLVSK